MLERQEADFVLDFVLDGKSTVIEGEDGDLFIEGYASDYGTDRDAEAFEPGCWPNAVKRYMETNPVLAYHHDTGKALGQVEQARIDDGGLWIRARVDAPAPGSWAEDVVRKIKRGTIRAFSVGGKFFRKMTDAGRRIYDVDLREISVTPVPANPRTLFACAKAAFDDPDEAAVADLEARLDAVETALNAA